MLIKPKRVDSALVPGQAQELNLQMCKRQEDGSSMVTKSKLGELGVKEREGNNQQSQELLLSVSASNDNWWLLKWHHGLVVLSRKGGDSRSAVGITWACFHCLKSNLTSTLPSYCQQSPTDVRGGVHLKAWFEGKWLERSLSHTWRIGHRKMWRYLYSKRTSVWYRPASLPEQRSSSAMQ